MYTHIKGVQILISLLKQYNIKHVVISPGTRNTALVGSIENDDFFNCYSIVDERSAGYLALGLSEALDVPVCISCTAATATCNYLPAIQEAYERNIQLIALTADQDPYEMFHMEDQCIDQVDMFHGYVKCAVDIPKVENEEDYWYANRRINEALLELNHHDKGPVQINYHMSYGLQEISTYDVAELPKTRKINRYDNVINYSEILKQLEKKQRILIIGGSDYIENKKLRESLHMFTKKFNCVVVADTYANIYGENEKILNPKALGDVITQSQISYLKPDLIISFGNIYYSTIKYFIKLYKTASEHWQIAIDGMPNDGYHCLTKIFECRPENFFQSVSDLYDGQNNDNYFLCWKKRIDMMHFQSLEFTNLAVIDIFCQSLPPKALLHTTVLDSIRMSNYAHMDPSIRCFANIGADGIDGSLSTYLGQVENESENAYLLIGDLSFMYDMNALLQYIPSNVRIVVINNYAGAEFHKNFGLQRIPTLNKHIAAGHNINIKDCCIGCQFTYLQAQNFTELNEQLPLLHKKSDRPILLEIFTDADKDAKALKDYWKANRQEIPGIHIDAKSRIKQIVRDLFGDRADFIKKIIRR